MDIKTYKLRGKTYIASKEEILINDWVTNGYYVWQWEDDRSSLRVKKIIKTDDKNLKEIEKLTIEEVKEIWHIKKT